MDLQAGHSASDTHMRLAQLYIHMCQHARDVQQVRLGRVRDVRERCDHHDCVPHRDDRQSENTRTISGRTRLSVRQMVSV